MIQSFYHESRLDRDYGELVKPHRQLYARLARLEFICEFRENSFSVFTLTLARDFFELSLINRIGLLLFYQGR